MDRIVFATHCLEGFLGDLVAVWHDQGFSVLSLRRSEYCRRLVYTHWHYFT